MTTDATPQDVEAEQVRPQQPFIAKAATYYRVTRYIMATILLAYGGWSIYDGFVSWPNWGQTHPYEKPKSTMDINFNKAIGIMLPPLGILVLVYSLRNSRGEYRLENNILSVPGHPPVPLDRIIAADQELWDRKGIVYIEYEVPGSPRAKLKLDDFVYQREATDLIFEDVKTALTGEAPAAEVAQPQAAPAPAPKAVVPKPAPKPTAAPQPAPAPAKPAVQKPTAVTPPPPSSVLRAKTPPRPKL